jgi:hypothetical protein
MAIISEVTLMIYLSKGILARKPRRDDAAVSHCGILHRLAGVQATLWLEGRYRPGNAHAPEQAAGLRSLADLGIVECGDDSDDAALFRLLTNCAICPSRTMTVSAPLNASERSMLKWLKYAGLRLTIAELVYLAEHEIAPARKLLGTENRQALTEAIYTAETIFDGILEGRMEHSPARDEITAAAMGLLRKRKIHLL